MQFFNLDRKGDYQKSIRIRVYSIQWERISYEAGINEVILGQVHIQAFIQWHRMGMCFVFNWMQKASKKVNCV